MKKKRLEINVILCLLFDIISESVLENYSGLLVLLIKCLAKQRFVTGLYCIPVVQRCTIACLWLAIIPVRPPNLFPLFITRWLREHSSAHEVRGNREWSPLLLCGFWKLNSGHQAQRPVP